MGVARYILIFFLLVSTLFVSAQIDNDTIIFDGIKHVKHIVKAGESLNKISNLYDVEVSNILEANEISGRLYYNQILYIPIYNRKKALNIKKYSAQKELKGKVTNVALLMPYYLVANDTMFNSFVDTSEVNSIYYPLSDVALSFHIGVTLAIDSLRRLGLDITLHTFDTNRDTNKVKQIIYSQALEDMDIIIGPLHAVNFKILCKKYGNDQDKIIINPLSRITRDIRNYRSVYQITPTSKNQLNIIKDHIIKNYKNKRLLVLYENEEKGLALYIQHIFRENKKNVKSTMISFTEIDSIRSLFSSFQIVIIPSNSRAFVSRLLASMGGIDSTFIVYGLDSWKMYDNLDIYNLMELSVHLPVSNMLNRDSKIDIDFLRLFEKEYNTNIGKYTHVGYNIIMHFLSDQDIYHFSKSLSGIKENIKAPIYHYEDYELIR